MSRTDSLNTLTAIVRMTPIVMTPRSRGRAFVLLLGHRLDEEVFERVADGVE